ncbi:MAG: HNH endonuclease [Candidatus Brockarchaeota archaeon]|nr:HNH endonuclease [Candidatus Brockarchaeota archaeon]
MKGAKVRRRGMLSLGLDPEEARSEFVFSEIVKGQLLKCPGCGAAFWTLDGFYDHLAWHEFLALEKGFRKGGSREPESRSWAMMRQFALLRDVGKCKVKGCGSRRKPEVHHIIPRELGGTDNLKNLATLCYFHHKGTLGSNKDLDLAEF